jgi:hypothetical protein
MSERDVRRALREAAAQPDTAARERAWRVVQGAYRERAPEHRPRRWARVVAITVPLVAAIAAGGAAAMTPHSGVGRLVRDVLGISAPETRGALVRVPGGGRLLVQDGTTTWVVAADGTRRRLGSYAGASWSPHGLFVAAWRDGVLSAAEPTGAVRWSLTRSAPVNAARWSPIDGFRIAYLSGRSLRVVNGDGTGDRGYGPALPDVAPAWRPDTAHVLAYADARSRVDVVAVDARKRMWRSAPVPAPVGLAWSAGGRRLLVASRRDIALYDRGGRPIASRPVDGAQAAAWSPRANAIAVVRANPATATSQLLLLDPARGLRDRLLFSGPGRFGAPAWAPDGRSLLLPWPAAGQWLFLRPDRSGRPTAIADIAKQFAPGARRPRFPDAVEWCCSRALGARDQPVERRAGSSSDWAGHERPS